MVMKTNGIRQIVILLYFLRPLGPTLTQILDKLHDFLRGWQYTVSPVRLTGRVSCDLRFKDLWSLSTLVYVHVCLYSNFIFTCIYD